jgi:hypothetical protein
MWKEFKEVDELSQQFEIKWEALSFLQVTQYC